MIGLIVAAAVVLLACVAVAVLILLNFIPIRTAIGEPGGFLGRQFDSNGERIYFTATSDSGVSIEPVFVGMHGMRAMRVSCASPR